MKKINFGLLHAGLTLLFGIVGGIWVYTVLNKYSVAKTSLLTMPKSVSVAVSVFIVAGIICSVVLKILSHKRDGEKNPMPKYVHVISAVFLIISGVAGIISVVSGMVDFTVLRSENTTVWLYKAGVILTSLLSAASSVYFIFKINGDADKAEKASLVIPLWLIMMIATSYFNITFTYTNFHRALLNISLAAMTLFFMSQTREVIERKFSVLRAISSSASILIGTIYILSRVIYLVSSGAPVMFSDLLEISLIGIVFFIVMTDFFSANEITDLPDQSAESIDDNTISSEVDTSNNTEE